MSEKVTFKISSAAAPYVGADKPRQERLKAAAGGVKLPPTDFVLLIYYLCHDGDPEVKRIAVATLRALDVPFLSRLLSDRELHPRILDALVQLHVKKPELAPLFAAHPMLSEKAAALLFEEGVFRDFEVAAEQAAEGSAESTEGNADAPEVHDVAAPGADEVADLDEDDARHGEDAVAGSDEDAAEPGDDEPVDGEEEKEGEEEEELEEEEFQSKYQMAQAMKVGQKIKAALTGDKEWRGILIKDSNKLVSGAVVKNPRITEGEVLTIAKSAVQNDEIMRVICANKEWVKNPLIRKALAENNKTPLPAALRFVALLSEKDLSSLAKSKNVSSVIASQARRVLLTKKDK